MVADAVKGLARQTAKATNEITRQIVVIQDCTAASVDAITNVSGTMESVQKLSSSIMESMEHQQSTTTDIAINIEQAAAESLNVSTQIQHLQETAERSESASNNIRSGIL